MFEWIEVSRMQQDEALRSMKVGNIMFTFLARVDKKQVCGLEGVGKKELGIG